MTNRAAFMLACQIYIFGMAVTLRACWYETWMQVVAIAATCLNLWLVLANPESWRKP